MNNKFYAPLRTSRHGGVSNLANDGNSTISGTAGYGQASVSAKIVTGAFDISQMAVDATKSNSSAVVNVLTNQAQSLATDFGRSINRQFFGDATEIVAQVSATSGSVGAGTAFIVPRDANLDDGRSIDNYGSVNGDINPTKYLAPGNIIAIGSPGTALGTITSINSGGRSATGTIVFTGNPAISSNKSIYLIDGSGQGAGTMGITGIRAALSSTTGTNTYAGVARSTIAWAPQFGSAAQALTLSVMESDYLAAREYAQSGDRYAIFMNLTLYKKYGDLLTSLRRTVNSTDLLGGWTGLEFAAGAGNVGVFLDYDVPDGEVLILNLDSWTICQVSDMRWMEDPAGGAMLRLSNKLQHQAEIYWFLELLCLAPAANARETQKTA